jgi:hypothetical protein
MPGSHARAALAGVVLLAALMASTTVAQTVPAGYYYNGTAIKPCPVNTRDINGAGALSTSTSGRSTCAACAAGFNTNGTTGNTVCGACML